MRSQINPIFYINLLLYYQENISGVPAFLLLLDHFHFFSKVKEQLMQNIVNSPSAPSMMSYQNVSTSCSTLATDTEYAYESIISDTNDGISSEGSTSAVTLQSGNESDCNPGGSSSECLLLSSKDSLNSDHVQAKQTFSRCLLLLILTLHVNHLYPHFHVYNLLNLAKKVGSHNWYIISCPNHKFANFKVSKDT